MTNGSPSFGDLLKTYRAQANMTQETLAERAGLSVRGISDLERGARNLPRRATVSLLADALQLSPYDRTVFLTAARLLAPTTSNVSPTASSAALGNPPLVATPLVGRETDLAALAALLARTETRMITLTGPGGVGKTRLALAVVMTSKLEYPDANAFVSLAALSDHTLVATAIAQALGQQTESVSPQESITTYLRNRRFLLTLDNFEHVIAARTLLTDLLTTCPGLVLLVTSREALHIQSEHEWLVTPLALPSAHLSVAQAAASPTVMLFAQRAQARKPDFALTDANIAAVCAICQRLDGLPLAIELAAAHSKLLSPQALLHRLERRLPVLEGGAHDLPQRHQTMRHAISWSYDLLSSHEQALFRRLAIFTGGATLEAAEAICTGASTSNTNLFFDFEDLLNKSLLWQRSGADEQPRLGMLETIREYALEQLSTAGETEQTYERYFTYYLELAEEATPHLTGPTQGLWLSSLEDDLNNFRAVIHRAIERDLREQGLRVVCALSPFWLARGHAREALVWFEQLLSTSQSHTAPPTLYAHALIEAGYMAYMCGEYLRAQLLSEHSLALYQELNDPLGTSQALDNLAQIAFERGEYEEAITLYERSLALRQQFGAPRQIAASLCNLGNVWLRKGRYAQAAPLHAQSLAILRELGDQRSIAVILNTQGNSAVAVGQFDRAITLYEEALTIVRNIGDVWGEGAAYNNLSDMAREQGDFPRMREFHAQALALLRDMRYPLLMVECLESIAHGAVAQHDAKIATQIYAAADALRASLGAPIPESEQTLHRERLAWARQTLGEHAFDTEWARNQETARNHIERIFDIASRTTQQAP